MGAQLWDRHEMRQRRTELKTVNHPTVGMMSLHYESLDLGPDGTRLGIYQAMRAHPTATR